MRKTWSMILALTMAVSLAGCSSGGNDTKETPSTATQETEGTVQTGSRVCAESGGCAG